MSGTFPPLCSKNMLFNQNLLNIKLMSGIDGTLSHFLGLWENLVLWQVLTFPLYTCQTCVHIGVQQQREESVCWLRWLFQWTRMVDNWLIILWEFSGDKALSSYCWCSIFTHPFLSKEKKYFWEVHPEENSFLVPKLWILRNKFPTAHVHPKSKRNWTDSKYSIYLLLSFLRNSHRILSS